MTLTGGRSHSIAFGLIACALGISAIVFGDHHTEIPFKCLVGLGVTLVLAGLFLLRYSWSIGKRGDSAK